MCDTIASVGSANAKGGVLFGKNSDREYDEAQYLEWLAAADHAAGARVRLTYREIDQVRHTHAVLLSKPHWIWGAEIGANEHALVIGNEALFSKIEASLADGIIGMDYLRLALERAQDVDEGIFVITSLLREHGQAGKCGFRRDLAYHNSFILADPRGAKVLETVDREWVVSPVTSYYSISNAMTIDTGFIASSPNLQRRAIEAGLHESRLPFAFNRVFEDEAKVASGRHRHARATELLRARNGRLETSDFFRILRDHQEGVPQPGRPSGPRICTHTRDNPLGQTTASWVTAFSPRKVVHWVTGTSAPCTGLFKPVLMETRLPQHGPKPGSDQDSASLWWRHEQLCRGLDRSREAVRDSFSRERDELEKRFLQLLEGCSPVIEEQSRVEAQGLIEVCWREALAFESRWHGQLLC